MANATKITVRELTPNTVLAQPTADVLDTGTAAVTIGFKSVGDLHNYLLELTNTAAAADKMTFTVNAGVIPPAVEQSYGDLAIEVSQNGVSYVVLDSSRFAQADGSIKITSKPASGKTQTATIRCFKMPK